MKRFLLVCLLLVACASTAPAAVDNLTINKKLTLGRAAKATIDGATGNIKTAGTITTTGGVVGGVSTGAFADGDASTPGMVWTLDANTGFYRIGADNLGMTLAGTKRWDFSTTTSALTGILTVSGASTLTGAVTMSGAAAIAGHTDIGGGYGSTGADIGTDGAIRTNGTLLVDGASTLTGATEITGDLTINTTSATVTGTTGASTWAGHMDIGGGYGGSGADIGTDGAIRTNASIVVDGTGTITGAAAFDGGIALDTSVLTVADTTGVISWVPTTTTSSAGVFNFTALTSGNGMKLIGVDATLNGGKYINVYGGTNATSVWSLAEGGATLITPNVATISPLYIDGTVTTTADLVTLKAVAATLNGGKYISCLDTAAVVFSVGEDGVTTIAPVLNSATALALTLDATTTGGGISMHSDSDTFAGTYINVIGGQSHNENVWTVGTSGATTITPAAVTGATATGLTIDETNVTSGDGVVIHTDTDTFTGKALRVIGGASHNADKFTVDTSGNTAAAGTLAVTGATTLTGALRSSVTLTATDSTDTVTITSAYYGKLLMLTHADAVAVTLPAAAEPAGSWFDIALVGDNSLAVVMATPVSDNLVTGNNASADSVTFGSGHRIGAHVHFWSDGSLWHADSVNASCTMTITDAG